MTRLRAAVLSSPRTGGTWLRRLLGTAYRLREITPFAGADAALSGRVPRRVVLHAHTARTDTLAHRLRDYGFHVFTTVRHPLDVLVSLLRVSSDPVLQRWPAFPWHDLVGATPRSEAFLAFATGAGAAALFAISLGWSREPGVVVVRYEEFFAHPEADLRRLGADLGREPARPFADAIAAHTLDAERDRAVWRHAWRGEPNTWRSLLIAEDVRAIVDANRDVFDALGYTCDPDESLAPETAELNWYRLEASSTSEMLGMFQERLAGLGPTALAFARAAQRGVDALRGSRPRPARGHGRRT